MHSNIRTPKTFALLQKNNFVPKNKKMTASMGFKEMGDLPVKFSVHFVYIAKMVRTHGAKYTYVNFANSNILSLILRFCEGLSNFLFLTF